MKFVSKLALAATLTAGLATTVAVAPAAAQKDKKGDANAAPALKLSDAVRKPIAAAQAALKANDNATAMTQIAAAEAVAKTDDEIYVVNAMKLPLVAAANDPATLVPILDKLIVNPKTPPAALPQYNYFRGAMPYQQKKYAEALPYLIKARDLGYKNENLTLQLAQARVETGDVSGGVAEIQKAIDAETAAGRKAPEAWYDYAIAKLYGAKNTTELNGWLRQQVVAYPSPKNWRKVLLIYREGMEKGGVKLDRGQQLDLFRLMRGTKALADRGDYVEYADMAFYAGLPGEAKTVIEEGRATGKIPATDPGMSKLLTDSNTAIRLEGSLTSVEAKAKAAANGKTAAQTGDAYLALGNAPKAVELYQVALQKGGVDVSEVNLHLGAALVQTGAKDQARTAFQAVTAPQRKDIAAFWLQWLDIGTAPAAAAVSS